MFRQYLPHDPIVDPPREDPRQPLPDPGREPAQGRIPRTVGLSTHAERYAARGDRQPAAREYLPRQVGRVRRADAHPRVHEGGGEAEQSGISTAPPPNSASGGAGGLLGGDQSPAEATAGHPDAEGI